jgi:hypothetical protein
MPDRCATRAVQLHLLAAISWFCVSCTCQLETGTANAFAAVRFCLQVQAAKACDCDQHANKQAYVHYHVVQSVPRQTSRLQLFAS